MLLRVNLATGKVTGSSVYVHDLGTAGRIYCSGRWRLDNRDELLGRLGLPPSATDAELIVRAYLAFGASHPEPLLGDFAYALFDARDRRLWLVRDHMGVIPLYYHRAGDLCIASPSLHAMLTQPDIPRDLDDGIVAEWCMNGHVFNQVDTFHVAIKKVPRATRLRLAATTRQASVYWSPDDVAPLVETREPVLVEQLRELLDTAILCRLGTTGGQAAHLSGGLDSTPIAIVAGRACRQQGRDFHTWNWCRPEAGDDVEWHEWADARRVAQAEGFIHREIEITPDTLLEVLLHHDPARDGTTLFSYERLVVRQAHADGITRIFSGFGGDEILSTRSRDRHSRALRSGRFLYVLRRLLLESDLGRPSSLPRMIQRFALLLRNAWWATPPVWLSTVQSLESKARSNLGLLRPEFAAHASQFIHDVRDVFLAENIHSRQIAYIGLGYHQERIESWAMLGERHGIDYVYPFLDKRLVEFALALPEEWYFRRGQSRYLYRQALDDCLPEEIKTKGKPTEPKRVRHFTKQCRAALLHPKTLERIASCASPYIDTGTVWRKLEKLRLADPLLSEQHVPDSVTLFKCVLALNWTDKKC